MSRSSLSFGILCSGLIAASMSAESLAAVPKVDTSKLEVVHITAHRRTQSAYQLESGEVVYMNKP